LKRSDLFEIGIHPNCLDGSTHGKNEDEVLKHIKELVPDAVSMRTHALYQSSPFLTKAALDYGILIDVSIFLPRMPNLAPHCFKLKGARLWRVPYYWEDDYEMSEDKPIWKFSDPELHLKGLKVFDFHPVCIMLNNDNYHIYEKLKRQKPLAEWTPDFIRPYINKGRGPQTLFLELIDFLSGGGEGRWIKEIIFNSNTGKES